MKLAVIILHFGNIEDTATCIKSVLDSNFEKEKIKVIIVNNDVNADNESFLKLGIKEKDIINNKKNLGFAKGINIGIKSALSDKNISDILLLNNDTILEKNTLKLLVDKKQEIVSPVIKFRFENIWKYDYGGRINWWIGRTSHIESTNHLINQSSLPAQAGNQQIDYVSGCCMRVKREVFESIGLLDEQFFFYFEDVDFCVRAKKAGFHISVVTDAYITHKLSASIGKWSKKAIYYNLTSNAKFIRKHLGLRSPIGFIYLFLLSLKIVWNKIR